HFTPDYIPHGIPFLSVKDISQGFIDFSNCRYISEEEHKQLTQRCNPEFNDVLLTKVGTTGIAKVVDTRREFSIFVSVALIKMFPNYLFPKYLEYCINSPFVKKQSSDGTWGVGNKNLVLKTIKIFSIPLPPLAEQKAIVEKVDKLMNIIDQLEQQIKHRKQLAENLMQTVLREDFE
ncbi:MAG: restriction endonuclease subunit S, partial [Pseudanabaena sp.]